VQEYERIFVFRKKHDGTYIDYSDTGLVAKGNIQKDSSVDYSGNKTEKNKVFSITYDSQYRAEVSRKWIYNCK